MHDLSPEEVEEVRQLATDLRNAAQDGRLLADRYANLLRNVVEEYCSEFEARADAVLRKLDSHCALESAPRPDASATVRPLSELGRFADGSC